MTIDFYLNRENRPRRVSPAPDLTVLQYLRGNGLRGSKEGCASGDCGACTAALATPAADGDSLDYTPVNTCICFMSALHGKLLVSVDGLAEDNGDLHPVQEAMVDAHGSQCGFCTPGFVMSLFAMTKAQVAQNTPNAPNAPPPAAAHNNVVSAIAGNLCRCTGYRPIIAAGKGLLAAPPAPDYYDQQQKTIAARLRDIAALPACAAPPAAADNTAGGSADAAAPDIVIAARAADIAAHKKRMPTAALLAGGTDLALAATIQDQRLPPKIDLSRATDLRGIEDTLEHWRIGAAVTVGEFMEYFTAPLPAFAPYLHRFGSAPIRARATVGGNIGNASPIADLPPPLIALGAQVVLDSGEGRRQLPLEAFYLDYKKTVLRPDEWISAVILPKPAPDSLLKIYKISKRIEDDISAVAGAFFWRIADGHVQEARLAYGGMAATPLRAAAAEERYANAPWTAQTTEAAAAALPQDFTPLTDARASAAYRLQTAAALLRRAWHETQTPAPRIESYCHAD